MASRVRRKKSDSVSIWQGAFPRVLNSCLLVCCLFNFVALWYGVRSSSPKEVHHVDSVVTNHFFVVTQFVASATSPRGSARDRDIIDDVVGKEIPISYHYFLDAYARPMFKFYGHYYAEGDTTSYGKVRKIFPDRVLLDGPVYLRNTSDPDGVVRPSIKDPLP